MSKSYDEFSICLNIDDKSAAIIQKIRRDLPASPYRDDPPHMTIIKGIHSSVELSDRQLAERIELLVPEGFKQPLEVSTTRLINLPSPAYKVSSVFLLRTSRQIKSWRRQLVKNLLQAGFKINWRERLVFTPHVTLRLGVALSRSQKQTVKRLIHGQSRFELVKLSILRFKYDQKQRGVYEITVYHP